MDGEGVGNEEREGVRQRKALEPDDIGACRISLQRVAIKALLLAPCQDQNFVDAQYMSLREVVLFVCLILAIRCLRLFPFLPAFLQQASLFLTKLKRL
jgi:hypothetical protein